jgi:hypothetical protein
MRRMTVNKGAMDLIDMYCFLHEISRVARISYYVRHWEATNEEKL